MLRRFRARPLPPKLIMLVFFLVLVGLGFWLYSVLRDKGPDVQNFDACVAAGNPVRETFPEQCSHNGKIFFKPGQEPYDPKKDLRE